MTQHYYFASSVPGLDLATDFAWEHREMMGFVQSTGKLDFWYLPIGAFVISESIGLIVNHQRKNHCGQVIVHAKNADTFWHAASIPHHALYRKVSALLAKEEEILLYLGRRCPVTDPETIREAVDELARSRNMQISQFMIKQLAGIIPRLPMLCDRCRQETDKQHAVPDEEHGVCQNCLERHYRICWDCEKPVPLEEVKYDSGDAMCPNCLQWGKSIGFR